MCNCGCNTCETKGPLLTEGKVKSLLSEGLQYHIDKKIPIFETVYRIGSDKHLSLIKEARKMYSRNVIDLCEEDEALIKTHLGEFALYEGESVPLDLPMLNEFSLPKFDVVKPIIDKFLGGVEKAGKKLIEIVKREGKQTLVLIKEIAEYVISGEKPTSAEQKKITEQLKDLGFLAFLGIAGNIPFSLFSIIYFIIDESGIAKEFLKLNESLNEEELTSKEQKIVDDILKELSESNVNTYLDKIKNYAKKGLLTIAMISSIASGLQAQGVPQNDIDNITQNSIELVQQKDIVDSESESLLKDSLSKRQFEELKKEAEEVDGYITAVKGTNRNALSSQANMQAKVHTKQGKVKIVDTKTYSVGGKYLYIMIYQVNTLNEAEFKGKDVPLNKPKRGGSKAYYVYVRDPKTKKIKKVSFGSGGLRAKIKNKEARNAFAARHNCKDKKDRTKAGYWSCNLPRYASALGLGANMNTFW